jgi:hypothetical protein
VKGNRRRRGERDYMVLGNRREKRKRGDKKENWE